MLGDARARDDIAILSIKFIGDPVIRDFPGGRTWMFDVKDAEAATHLRREIMTYLTIHATATEPFMTELITGELLSNVVKHTPGLIEVTLDWNQEPAMLSVDDRGDGFIPSAALPEDDYSENDAARSSFTRWRRMYGSQRSARADRASKSICRRTRHSRSLEARRLPAI